MKIKCIVMSLMVLITLTVPALAAEEGLAARWSFDGSVADASGNGRDLAEAQGGASYTEGVDGQALLLDGKTLLTMAPEHAISSENITLTVWIKINSFPESDNNTNCLIVNEYLGALGVGAMDFGIREGKLYSYVCGANWQAGDTLTSVTDAETLVGKWTHVAVVFDQDSGIGSLYINGELDFELELYNTLGIPATLGYQGEFPSNVDIGGYLEGETLKRSFDGAVDELRLYTRALTAGEVAAMAAEYESGEEPSESAPASEAPSASPSAEPSASPSAPPASDGDDGGLNPWIFVIIGVGAVLAGGAVFFIFKNKGGKS